MEAKNLYLFKEGEFVRSKFSHRTYRILHHYKNGISFLHCIETGVAEYWNAYNNAHFISADYISLGTMSLI